MSDVLMLVLVAGVFVTTLGIILGFGRLMK
jgi:hypothetical protein